MIVSVDAAQLEQLAELARQAAEQHPPRSAERRAAAALWVALTDAATIAAAKRALAGFASPEVEAAAIQLLHKLAAALAATETSPPTGGAALTD